MGNVFEKSKNQIGYHANNDLRQSLIHCNLTEKINYLENKLDMLDNDFYVYREITQANIKVMSTDLHHLHQQMVSLKK